ncbi:GMC family oxidoreductase N-terminal domain-containing protein [Spirillospora sp. NPDC050679]
MPLSIPALASALVALASRRLARYPGLLDIVVGETIAVVCGAGVGGSSLVYAGMLPQPRADVFERVFPAELDHDLLDRVHYPRARRRLVAEPFPEDLLSHPHYRSNRLWRSASDAAGAPVRRLDLNFDFDVIRAELAGRATPSATIGEYCLTGCNSGAKLSVDRTYLARAEASGRTRVRPLHHVTHMAQLPSGRYRLAADRLSDDGEVVEQVLFECDKLIVAAGAVHTPRMLVTARATGALPGLNESVGLGWGTNGDQGLVVKADRTSADVPQGGPPAFLTTNDEATTALTNLPLPFAAGSGLMVCLGMGIPGRSGRWVFDGLTGRARLEWDPRHDAATRRQAGDLLRRITGRIPDGAAAANPSAAMPITAHPLGGAVIGRATDAYGRLHGHRGLYCLDGSLIPGGAAAVNPALTIAAVVERCLDRLVPDDFAA